MAWTNPKTWTAALVSVAELNTHVRDNENWLYPVGAGRGVVWAWNTADFALGTTGDVLPFAGESVDIGNAWDTTNNRYVVPYAGHYRCDLHMQGSGPNAGQLNAFVNMSPDSGTNWYIQAQVVRVYYAGNSQAFDCSGFHITTPLAAGNWLRFGADFSHASGVTIDGGTAQSDSLTYMSIQPVVPT